MGFDAWSLTSQETSLITEVFVDEVLQLPLFLNTGGFFREGIERWVSLGKSHNHQVTETLTSSLYSNVFSLNTVCIEKKKTSFQFLVLLNTNSGTIPTNFDTAYLLSSLPKFTCCDSGEQPRAAINYGMERFSVKIQDWLQVRK